MPDQTSPQLVAVAIEDEMRQAYLDYSMSVIVGPSLPDVRDGLKPVHRRILYAMFDQGRLHNKRYSKAAGTVGEVLKKYHPHGDASVYDALVRLAQDWNMRAPLIDGQGNFGSIDGDPAAAFRYTEARLTRLAEMMLADIDKDTVDFGPNFDDSTTEPLVLPARFPNLLVNGSAGIALGLATKIPPHNLREVIESCVHLVDHPDPPLRDLPHPKLRGAPPCWPSIAASRARSESSRCSSGSSPTGATWSRGGPATSSARRKSASTSCSATRSPSTTSTRSSPSSRRRAIARPPRTSCSRSTSSPRSRRRPSSRCSSRG